jgi:pimeloyl-ACP methyl ester carboxylesterase
MRFVHAGLMAAILAVLVGHSDAAEPTLPLVAEEFMVDSYDPGIQLYVRNKHPADMTQVPPEHILLYMHGSTQPSEATFDLVLDGFSWMDFIAGQGWDVYLMDARGYGGSTRSPEFAQPDATEAPAVSTDTKVRDAEAAIDFILKRRGASRISLLGWSFGTIVFAAYAADHPDKVSNLILYAPPWCRPSCAFEPRAAQSESDVGSPEMGPMFETSMADARNRMQTGVPFGRREELLPPEWFSAWWDVALKTDPVGAMKTKPMVRVPAGVNQNFEDYWDQGRSYYDPKRITTPTLVIVGDMDRMTPPVAARMLHDALENSAGRQFVEIKDASHIMMLEKNRLSLFEAVQRFLDAGRVPQ